MGALRKKRKPNKIKQFVCEECNSKYELKKTPNKGRPKLCKECLRVGVRERARAAKYHKRPEYKLKSRKWQLQNRYGLSLKGYNGLLEKQNGVCAICKQDNRADRGRPLVVDHSHSLNKVRGLLCDKCNRAIGAFGDNTAILHNVITYLKGEDYEKN